MKFRDVDEGVRWLQHRVEPIQNDVDFFFIGVRKIHSADFVVRVAIADHVKGRILVLSVVISGAVHSFPHRPRFSEMLETVAIQRCEFEI